MSRPTFTRATARARRAGATGAAFATLVLLAVACAPDHASVRTGDSSAAAPATGDAPTTPPTDAELAAARALADSLGGTLQRTLAGLLQTSGPEAAVTFCADSAQLISARFATYDRYVRRVSLQTRNDANRPDSAESAMLQRLDSLHRAGQLPADESWASIDADGRRVVHFVRPIVIATPCLACHGDPDTMQPAVRDLIASRYPGDRATGYAEGDLRGAFSVRLRGAPPE
jgi:hypothetical protein